MPDETIATPVIGDGVVTLPIPGDLIEGKKMPAPFDIPDGVGGLFMADLVGSVTGNNAAQRSIFSVAAGALQASIVKQSSQMDTEESRAISGVMGTPIGGPTNKQV